MIECDIEEWASAEVEPRRREFRQAVHTVLHAVARSEVLAPQMLIKGGMLLAIRYQSNRYTRDVDFSTSRRLQAFDKFGFLQEFEMALGHAVVALPYDLDCRVQSHRVKPASPDADFPTLKLKVGYAPKGDRSQQKRLSAGESTKVVEVDYSFNEVVGEPELLRICDDGVLRAYSFPDLIAEKYRALLQQVVRNRVRRQDAYDLYISLRDHAASEAAFKQRVLDALLKKASARDLNVHRTSICQAALVERSRKEFRLLQDEISEELPPFEQVYSFVTEFYQSLPWPSD